MRKLVKHGINDLASLGVLGFGLMSHQKSRHVGEVVLRPNDAGFFSPPCSVSEATEAVETALRQLGLLESARKETQFGASMTVTLTKTQHLTRC